MCAQLLRFQNYTRWILHATKVKKKAAPAAKSEAEMDALAKSIDASMTMSKLTDAQRHCQGKDVSRLQNGWGGVRIYNNLNPKP